MLLETIITGLIGVVTTSLVGIISYQQGKRKQNAEAALIEVQSMQAISEFYKKALQDTNEKLGYYIKMAEDSRKIAEDSRQEVLELRALMNKMVADGCLVKSCKERVPIDKIKKK